MSGTVAWALAALAAVPVALSGGLSGARAASLDAARSGGGRIVCVGAENEYANVMAQVGGPYVRVAAIMSNPNTDPHTFEASAQVAAEVASAQLVVQNGVGYDTFMGTIESASPSSTRKVVDVQTLRHLANSTPNPHLWYTPATMPAVAKAVARDLSELAPAHKKYFRSHAERFDRSLGAWRTAIASLKAKWAGAPVATTEPVADYMLQAAGIDNLTPFAFQADIMNGVDPSPQDVAYEQTLIRDHKVKAFVYNQQVTDQLTQSFLALAAQAHVPVVGVYETMPTPGYDYQTWMVAEVHALTAAFASGRSSPKL
jgi:zinc/manganese transport system substrate-binding protein